MKSDGLLKTFVLIGCVLLFSLSYADWDRPFEPGEANHAVQVAVDGDSNVYVLANCVNDNEYNDADDREIRCKRKPCLV